MPGGAQPAEEQRVASSTAPCYSTLRSSHTHTRCVRSQHTLALTYTQAAALIPCPLTPLSSSKVSAWGKPPGDFSPEADYLTCWHYSVREQSLSGQPERDPGAAQRHIANFKRRAAGRAQPRTARRQDEAQLGAPQQSRAAPPAPVPRLAAARREPVTRGAGRGPRAEAFVDRASRSGLLWQSQAPKRLLVLLSPGVYLAGSSALRPQEI